MSGARTGNSAFTLIELLVVIGIIAATAGVIGLALRDGSPSAALQSAQSTVASLLSSARSQAALKGKDAAVMLAADASDSTRYLHALTIAVYDGTAWQQTSDYVNLPDGAYLVPPTGAPVESGVSFAANGGTIGSTALNESVSLNNATHLFIRYTPLGAVGGSGGYIVISTATRQPSGSPPVKFNNDKNVRGLLLSAYGAVSLVNDRSGF